MNIYSSHSLDETRDIAERWLVGTAREANDRATVVGLSGHLGAGKTAFVKMVAKLLGVNDEVTSPTFVIMKIYELGNVVPAKVGTGGVKWKHLVHIDAYRLENREELEVLGFGKLIADPGNLVMVEWPENVGVENITAHYQKIRFEIVGSQHRICLF